MESEILCPFCGAPWSKHAHALWEDAEIYDTVGAGSPDVCITISCDNCGRVMYQKDSVERG
jgi:hypothetical protein